MRVKITGPEGFSKVLTVQDDDPLQKLIDESGCPGTITAIRFGYPPQKVDCSPDNLQLSFETLGISSGEKITLITQPSAGELPIGTRIHSGDVKLPITAARIVLPENQQRIIQIHEVPDDNSCLFHAISYCFYKDITISSQLRALVSQEVLADQATYSEAVLDKPNKDYAAWILRKDSWGGGIEIAILSKKLGVAIYVLDMDAQQYDKFNEDQFDQFIVIMFNGIHYDSVELDDGKTVFDKRDLFYSELIISGALQIAEQMKQTGHSFNTRKDKIMCNICKATMIGEREVAKHAETTGHVDFGQA